MFDFKLAYLENLRTSRLNDCAILIQKNLRAKYYRRRYLEARAAIIAVQSYCRGLMARREAQEMRKVKAAITIQRYWRGYFERRKFSVIRNSVVLVQAFAKGYLCRKNIMDQRIGNAARYIQRAWKSRYDDRYGIFRICTHSFVGGSSELGSCTGKGQYIFRVYGVVRWLGENIRRCVKKHGT